MKHTASQNEKDETFFQNEPGLVRYFQVINIQLDILFVLDILADTGSARFFVWSYCTNFHSQTHPCTKSSAKIHTCTKLSRKMTHRCAYTSLTKWATSV